MTRPAHLITRPLHPASVVASASYRAQVEANAGMYVPFEETSGANAQDAIVPANHGSYGPGVVHVTGGPAGTPVAMQASRPDGLVIGSPVAVGQGTLTVWVKTTEAPVAPRTIGSAINAEGALQARLILKPNGTLQVDVGRLHLAVQPLQRTVTSPAVVNNGTWHEVVLVDNGTNVTLYVDGSGATSTVAYVPPMEVTARIQDQIARISPATGKVVSAFSIPSSLNPGDVGDYKRDGNGYTWITYYAAGTSEVRIVKAGQADQLLATTVPGASSLAYNALTDQMYIGSQTTNLVEVFDATSKAHLSTLTLGTASPALQGQQFMSVSVDNTYLLFSNGAASQPIYKYVIATAVESVFASRVDDPDTSERFAFVGLAMHPTNGEVWALVPTSFGRERTWFFRWSAAGVELEALPFVEDIGVYLPDAHLVWWTAWDWTKGLVYWSYYNDQKIGVFDTTVHSFVQHNFRDLIDQWPAFTASPGAQFTIFGIWT